MKKITIFKNSKIYLLIYLLPALAFSSPSLTSRAALELGLTPNAEWTYVFSTRGVEYTEEGSRPWNYTAIFSEKIIRVRQQKNSLIFAAIRTRQSQHGKTPDPDFLPRMGKIFYILKKGEPVYTHWDAYASIGKPDMGIGVYQQDEQLDLAHLARAPILYVLPLRVPSAWHQSISERLDKNSSYFVSGPRCEKKIARMDTQAGPMTDCYEITQPSTTTIHQSWICRGVGLVRQREERPGGEGHGSLIYHSDLELLGRKN